MQVVSKKDRAGARRSGRDPAGPLRAIWHPFFGTLGTVSSTRGAGRVDCNAKNGPDLRRQTKVRSDSVALTPVPTTGHTLVMVAQPQVLSIDTREAVHGPHQYAIMDTETGPGP